MAEQQKPINQLVERIVKILAKNDGLDTKFFKYPGSISVVSIHDDSVIEIKYDSSDIHDFFFAFEQAVEAQTIMKMEKMIKDIKKGYN